MPDFTSEPAFQDIMQSEKVGRLSPQKRQEFLELLGDLTPEERQQLASGLSKPTSPPSNPIPGIQMEGNLLNDTSAGSPGGIAPQKGRDAVRHLWGNMAGIGVGMAAPYLLPATAGPLLSTAVDVAGNVLAGKTSQYVSGEGLAPTAGDVVNAALPLAIRGAGAGYRALTKPGQRAIQVADEANAAAAGQYAEERTAHGMQTQEWEDANRRAAQSAVQKDQTLEAARQKAIQIHQDALANVPKDAEAAVGRPDPQALYSQAKKAAVGAPAVETTNFQDTAQRLGIDFRLPAEGTQNNRFINLTDALQEFGADLAAPGAPVERVTATIQKLGSVIGSLRRTGGPELGAAKELYGSLYTDLKQAAQQSPQAKAAIQPFLEAQAAQRKVWALDDFQALFDPRKGYAYKQGNPEVKADSIKTGLDNLVANNPFFKDSLTTKELQTLYAAVEKLPQTAIPRMREPTQFPLEPVKGRPGEPPTMPEAVQAKMPAIPSGMRRQAGTALGYAIGATIGHNVGANPWFTGLGGGAVGLGLVSAPELVSRFIMAGPKGEQTLRRYMAGKPTLDSTDLAKLEAMGRAIGILK